jgi:exopolyphosphatase / guanosine-5'-triphosphate,3'-diphosphate pyrophosphatase
VRGACIDIGSNTTRLLVADRDPSGLHEVHQERAFTRISRGLTEGGAISDAKIAEVAGVVSDQLHRAHELGAEQIHAVATAAIRRAANRDALVQAVRRASDLEVRVLTDIEEARLAFVGAARTLGSAPNGLLGVADVGGGSSELVVGRAPDHVSWCASLAVGSGDLADEFLHSDPPSGIQLERAGARVAATLDGIQAPQPASAVAVGGSAASLRRVAGDLLDEASCSRALEVLMSAPAPSLARRLQLDTERVRLLPAGLLILRDCARRFGTPLHVGRGGLREGVLLEAAP